MILGVGVQMTESIFYNLGRMVGSKAHKARWIWESLTGVQANAIRFEERVGADLAREARSQLRIDPDLQIGRLLNDIGAHLAAHVADKRRSFRFELFNATEPNAFALPGGFIFISRSILTLCHEDPDQVAFILAHEMGHVISGHALERVLTNSALAAVSRAVPGRGVLGPWLHKVGIRFLETAYSRDCELDADRLAVRLMAAAGYDGQAGVTLLQSLASLKESADPLSLGQYFSTHPSFDLRIDSVRKLLAESTA